MPLPFLRGSSTPSDPSDSPIRLGKGEFFPGPTFLACVVGALSDALPHLAAGVGILDPSMF